MKLKEIIINKKILTKEAWNRESETPTLSLEDKKMFMEKVRNYTSYGSAIYSEHDLVEIADDLAEIADKAEIYTLSETEDQFDKITISRNIKELKGLSGNFTKVASEAKALKERMSGLYEDMGNILNRYFEVNDANIIDESESEDEIGKDIFYKAAATSNDQDEIDYAKDEIDKLEK